MLPAKLPPITPDGEEAPEGKTKRWVSHAHCDFVRSHCCTACGAGRPIEVAHLRNGTDGGVGRKPSDYWTVSLCRPCHTRQHRVGERTFWEQAEVDQYAVARAFAKASPKAQQIAAHKRSTGCG